MDGPELARSRKKVPWAAILRGLFLYALVPALLLALCAGPAGKAVRRDEAAAFLLAAAALGAVVLNWAVYRILRRKHPPLLVFAHGLACLTVFILIEKDAMAPADPRNSILSVFSVSLAMLALLLVSFRLAAFRGSRPALAAAVAIRAGLGILLAVMAYQVLRDFESRNVTRDTWITVAVAAAFIPAFNARRIRSAVRRFRTRRRQEGLAAGRIVKVFGETHLDRDDDAVTLFYAQVEYTVEGAVYETRAEIYRSTARKYEKDMLTGMEVPVRYNPADPADAQAPRVTREIIRANLAARRADGSEHEGGQTGNGTGKTAL